MKPENTMQPGSFFFSDSDVNAVNIYPEKDTLSANLLVNSCDAFSVCNTGTQAAMLWGVLPIAVGEERPFNQLIGAKYNNMCIPVSWAAANGAQLTIIQFTIQNREYHP